MLKKKILGIAVIILTAIGFTNAYTFTGNGVIFLSIDNGESEYWNNNDMIINNTNQANTNNYIITNDGNGNWRTEYGSGQYFDLLWIQDTNANVNATFKNIFFWNENKKLNYGATKINAGLEDYRILQPLKMLHTTPNEYINSIKNYNNYTYDIEDFYNLNGNITQIILGVDTDRNAYDFTSCNENKFLCFNFDNTDIYCIACNACANGFSCEGGTNIAYYITGYNSWNFSDFDSLIGESPFNGGNSGNNGTGGNTEQITQYSCPTIQQLINTYETDYTENLCYSSSLIYSGGTIQQITPKTIFELYPTYTGFTADISIYNTYCRSPNTTQACQTAFNGKDIEYTLLAKIPDNIKKANLYQYCNLKLNYPDKNATTCTLQASGLIATGLNETITANDIITAIGDENYTVITPGKPPQAIGTGNGSGSVYDGLLGDNEDDTERWNIIQNAKNIVQTMKELYTKFTGIFREREGTNGFIPEYITGILLLIILFKLFKK